MTPAVNGSAALPHPVRQGLFTRDRASVLFSAATDPR